MRRYQALLQDGSDPVDIGEFVDDQAAQTWAIQRYGADLAAVVPVSSYTVNTSTIDPIWYAVGMVGVLLFLAWGNGLKQKRGRHVR